MVQGCNNLQVATTRDDSSKETLSKGGGAVAFLATAAGFTTQSQNAARHLPLVQFRPVVLAAKVRLADDSRQIVCQPATLQVLNFYHQQQQCGFDCVPACMMVLLRAILA